MEFLVGHKFDVGALFTQGIRYLSREEEILAREEAIRRWAPSESMEAIEINLRDKGDVRFVGAVRRLIDAWNAGGKVSFLAHHGKNPPVKLTSHLRHAAASSPSLVLKTGRE